MGGAARRGGETRTRPSLPEVPRDPDEKEKVKSAAGTA